MKFLFSTTFYFGLGVLGHTYASSVTAFKQEDSNPLAITAPPVYKDVNTLSENDELEIKFAALRAEQIKRSRAHDPEAQQVLKHLNGIYNEPYPLTLALVERAKQIVGEQNQRHFALKIGPQIIFLDAESDDNRL